MKRFLFFIFFVLLLSFSSCRYISGKRINGNGNELVKERSIGSFDGVHVSGGIDVVVEPGPNSLKIAADENLHEYIIIENRGGIVEVHSRDGYNLNPRSGIKVYASAPSFRTLEVAGSGDIKSGSKISGNNDLRVGIRGSGDVQLDVDAPKVVAEIAGSGSMKLNGQTRDFTADIKGSGDVYSFGLLSEQTNVDIAGSGNAQVFASKKLNVDIKGAGDVAYKGTASVSQNIMGSGNIRRVE